MATNLVVNGVSYSYPQTGDQAGWGDQATFWATAVTSGMLQKAGGAFTLTGDANFGTNFGLIAKYFTSVAASAAATGTFRLASTDTIAWRNNANTGDIALSKNASDVVLFNGIAYADLSSIQTFTNKTLSAAANTITGLTNTNLSGSAGITYANLSLGGNIVNADISASAAIAFTKLALLSANSVLANNTGSPAIPASVAMTSAATASAVSIRDANANLSLNNLIESLQVVVSAAGTTTLAVGSPYLTQITGVTTQAITLPVASTLSLGQAFAVLNRSTGAVTVNSSGANLVQTMAANSQLIVTCVLISGTTAASWDAAYSTGVAGFTNPMTTGGDLIYGGASGVATRLANGSAAQVLTSNGTTLAPSWQPAGTASPLTTKGDLYGFAAANARIPVGSDNKIATADSTNANGLSYLYPVGKNYVSNPSFESGLATNWTLGTIGTLTNALPTGTPTFGSGAAGTLSLAIVSSGQLSGASSLSYVSSAATTAGNMFASSAMTIDISDQAKWLNFSFYYSAFSGSANCNFSGTSSNSYAVAFYDVTNSVWLGQSANFGMVQGSGVGICSGGFQTNSNTLSVRMCIFNSNATAGAATLYFDDFFLGRAPVVVGAAMSDWISSAGVPMTGFGTITSLVYKSKRVGDSLEVLGSFTSGTPTGVSAQIGVYWNGTAYTVDTSKCGPSQLIGIAGNNSSSATFFQEGVLAPSSNQTFVNMSVQQSTTSILTSVLATSLTGAGGIIEFSFSVPIVGWSSNTVQSSDFLGQTVSWNGTQTSQAATANVTDIAFTTINDRTGSWNGTQFKAPVSGDYIVVGQVTNSVAASAAIYVGGALYNNGYFTSAGVGGASSGSVLLTGVSANALISVRSTGTGTVTLSTIGIYKLAGPAVVQATESVNGRYFSCTTTLTSAFTTMTYLTKDFDSHNAYSAGTLTIPVGGKFQFNAGLFGAMTGAINGAQEIAIFKNGTEITSALQVCGGSQTNLASNISDTVSCLAGDLITVRALNNNTSPSIVASNFRNYLSWARVGN